MAKKNVWDILAWVAFGIVILYAFLKIVGVIESPLSFDIVALVSIAYFVGRYAKKMDDGFEDIESLKGDMKELNDKCPVFKEKEG